ncbi:hypothetical protein HUN58_14565 [Curtobacterium sp. Csp1]|uniref:hypothetical protein n=1 Tax=unclassified Curtobacterium TaxID=257496 RepID=UPI001598AFCD|nr:MULTISPECIES: hypothetical protein [unclassified Curtobacterium]QKS13934.1 hypothetical protein HUN60_13000 [Curtobacterium sp. csp3]QKS20977.1 hypothetical protein HUN58_14565 [Curtobacterium sp. Csp1]
MKDRAAGRRLRNQGRQVVAFVRIIPQLSRFMQQLGDAIAEIGRTAVRAAEVIGRSFYLVVRLARWIERQRNRDRWVATHQLPAHPSPWAAPITKEAP